ncbi:MAG: DUF3291 domain-containing protein [Flavobacteriaceae bacterium]|nr:MAG: DUF3291 domain-containing protein [Flavobacteriaceae bacterium]
MYHLAQVNIARMLAPIDDPVMADFVNNLDRINNLAEKSDGFIWRLKGEDNNATAIRVFEDPNLIINMSVWSDINALFDFTYKSNHIEVLSRKNEWFSKMKDMHMAFWYISEDHIPTPEEAKNRLAYMNKNGITPYAFNFRKPFSIEEMLNYKVKA